MLSNCGHDENYGASGGKAGDQTGTEYAVIPWYYGYWTHVFRHPDPQARNMIARLAIQAANNDLIGYDQSQRTTFWQHLKASNYDPSQITIACEADCSSSTAAISKAVGILLGIPGLANIDINMSTWVEVETLRSAGFQILTASKYLTSETNLLPGDILLKYGHTCIEVGNGNLSSFPYEEDDMPTAQDVWNYDGAMNKVNEINARSGSIDSKINNLNDQITEALSIVNKPSVIVEFGKPFHRLYNEKAGYHCYTNDEARVATLKNAGWKDEGVLFTPGKQVDDGNPMIYMVVNQLDDTLFTTNIEEAKACAAAGWATCGAIGYASSVFPVYRLYNTYTCRHLFTTDEFEYNSLKNVKGWNDEGIAFEAN